MALNDSRVPGRYLMWNTWDVKRDVRRRNVISWMAAVARGSKPGKLDNIVISCHGNSGSMKLGKNRFYKISHARMFSGLKGLVERIWLISCEVALIEKGKYNDGNIFVSEMAKAAGCYIMASTAVQKNCPWTYPYGQIDSFEGTVLEYGPKGNVVGAKTYGSWITNRE